MQDCLIKIEDFEFLSSEDRSRFEGDDGVRTQEQRNEDLNSRMGELASDDVLMAAFRDLNVDIFFRGKKIEAKTAVPSASEKVVVQFLVPQGYIIVSQEGERLTKSFGKLGNRVFTQGNFRFYYLNREKELVLHAVVPAKRVHWELSRTLPKYDIEPIPLVLSARSVDKKSWCFHLATGVEYRLSIVPNRPRRFPMHSFNVVVRSAMAAPVFPPTPFRIYRRYRLRWPRVSDFLTLLSRF